MIFLSGACRKTNNKTLNIYFSAKKIWSSCHIYPCQDMWTETTKLWTFIFWFFYHRVTYIFLSRYVNWNKQFSDKQIWLSCHTHVKIYGSWNNNTLNIYFLTKNLIIMSRTKRTNFRRWYVSWVPKYFIFDFLRKFFPHLIGKPKPCLEGYTHKISLFIREGVMKYLAWPNGVGSPKPVLTKLICKKMPKFFHL